MIFEEKEKKMFKELIKHLLNYDEVKDFEKRMDEIIFDKNCYHSGSYQNGTTYMVIPLKNYFQDKKLNLENFLLFHISIWREREKREISNIFYDLFNSTFYWEGVFQKTGIDMETVHDIFRREIYLAGKNNPFFNQIIERIEKGESIIFDSYCKIFINKKY